MFHAKRSRKAQTSRLRRAQSPFESLPDKPRVGNAARLCPLLESRQQLSGHTHVDLFVLSLKLKLCWFKVREVKVRQVLREERFRFLIGFESWHFLFHRLQSPWHAYSGPSRGGLGDDGFSSVWCLRRKLQPPATRTAKPHFDRRVRPEVRRYFSAQHVGE